MLIPLGKKDSITKTISESDVYLYSNIVGDSNPLHVDAKKAKESIFGNRVVHGMLIGSLISTVLGTKLPGEGTIYIEQNLSFKKPVFLGETVTAIAMVKEILNPSKGIYAMDTTVINKDGIIVIEGYAIVMNTKFSEKEINE